jgi:hypothetical protein
MAPFDPAIHQRRFQLGLVGLRLFLVQELVGQLFHAFEAQEGTADHQQDDHRRGQEGADQQRRRHQDRLVDERALGHRPHHRQLALGLHAGHLLGIERQVVAQHAGRLLGRDLGEDGNIVQHGGDVVEQEQKAGGHGG